MSNREVRVTILCEGRQDELFVRYFLVKRGFNPRKIRVVVSPQGKGAGEQFVRENYPKEVKEYRSQATYRSVCLVAITDADILTVQERVRRLEESLEENLLSKRQRNEKIAILVPKRNIETWIHYLQGESVDENHPKPYSKLEFESDCKPLVGALASQCQQAGLADDAPPSMQIACAELQRILPPS
jgi:hypothetical protein